MRALWLIGVVLTLFWAVSGCARPVARIPVTPHDNTSTIAGIVQRMGTGEPIPGARVSLQLGSPDVPRTTTDANGRFVFPNILPGRYRIDAQRDGYFGAPSNTIQFPSAVSAQITVEARRQIDNLILELMPGGVVTGRILDSTGNPGYSVQVSALPLNIQLTQDLRTNTNDRGEYRLYGLPPGDYAIAVTPSRGRGNDSDVRTYYPGTTDEGHAKTVSVVVGSDISEIDFGIQAPETFTVSGKIVVELPGAAIPPNGRFLPTVKLASHNTGPLSGPYAISAISQLVRSPDGAFEFRGVPPGGYDVVSQVQDGRMMSYEGQSTIDVKDRNIGNVLVQVGLGVDLRVDVVGGLVPFQGLPHRSVQLVTKSPGHGISFNGHGDGTRTVSIPHIAPGDYTFMVVRSSGQECVKDILQSGKSIFIEGITIGSQTPEPVQIILEIRDALPPPEPRNPAMPVCPSG